MKLSPAVFMLIAVYAAFSLAVSNAFFFNCYSFNKAMQHECFDMGLGYIKEIRRGLIVREMTGPSVKKFTTKV